MTVKQFAWLGRAAARLRKPQMSFAFQAGEQFGKGASPLRRAYRLAKVGFGHVKKHPLLAAAGVIAGQEIYGAATAAAVAEAFNRRDRQRLSRLEQSVYRPPRLRYRNRRTV